MKQNAGIWAFIAVILVLLAIVGIFFGISLLFYWLGLLIKFLFKAHFEWSFIHAMASTALVYILYWLVNIFVKD